MIDDSAPSGRGRDHTPTDGESPDRRSGAGAARPPGPHTSPRRRAFRLPKPRSGAGTALILLGLIMLPSAVLGVLSWRAIRSEKSYSLERLRTSYRQLANLAARQMDYQLSSLESRWIGEFDALLGTTGGRPSAEQVRGFEGREPLIAQYFLLAAPGRLVYPPGIEGEAPLRLADGEVPSPRAREHEPFARLVARGEELEYGAGDFKAAIAVYREILARIETPRLRAVAESHVGRAQLKDRDWTGALATYRRLLEVHPDERDLDRMYLRFLAQYQIAVSLEGLGRHAEALETLLELDRDLRRRSDAITTLQYSYYEGLIQALAPRLLESAAPWERDRYRAAIGALGEQSKKHISERYFVHLLEAELSEMSFRHKRYSPRIRYMAARTEGVPFLLAYRTLPDAQETFATGILAAEIDLDRLQSQLFSAMRSLHADTEGALAILESGGHVVIGAEAATGTLMASQALSPPFDSWQVALYLQDVPTAMKRLDLRHTIWSWLISLMLLSILLGGYLFILRARRQAHLARAQTTFVSNVTHELRTPLASIRMFAELLELQMSDPRRSAARAADQTRKYLAIIRQECDRLNRLIERVLDFSRMERNVKRYRLEPSDVGAVVGSAVESFRPYAEARGFSLALSIEGDLPPVRLDADAFSQVMLNLLTNAVQYSTTEKEIHVRVHGEGGRVCTEVSDRGVGIEPQDLRRVFDEFYSTWRRMDDRTQGGLGLGLTLSREIARAHGGEITVRSEVGAGSTFTVTLPAVPTQEVVDLVPTHAADLEVVERLGGQRG